MMKWQSRRIGDFIHRVKDPVTVEDWVEYKQVTIRMNYKGVVLRGLKKGCDIKTKNQWRVRSGLFILSRIDARNGAFGIIPEELEGAIVSNDFLAYEIDQAEVDIEFFNSFLQSPIFLEACIKASRGNTNRKRVNESFFLDYQVELPTLPEQQRLITRINEAKDCIGIVDKEITHQETLLAKLKQAILQEAIQGKLTADWRKENSDVEPASQLLERIQQEKQRLIAEKKIRKEKSLPPITSEEIPFEIPDSWEWCRFSDICINLDRERKPISKAQRKKKKKVYPYYGASGIIDKIDGFTHEGRFLLIGEDGSNLRLRSKPIAFEAKGKIWVNNHAHVVKFTNPTLQDFVEHKINGMDLTAFVTGGFQPKLSQGNLNRIPIPLPPIAELPTILERVESLLESCRQLETEIKYSRTHAENLLHAVLKEAFTAT